MFFAPLSTYLLLGAMERGGRARWGLYARGVRCGRLHALPGRIRAAGPDRVGGLGRPERPPPAPGGERRRRAGLPPARRRAWRRARDRGTVRAGSVLSEALKILSGVPEVRWNDVPGTPAGIALIVVAATLLGAAVVRLARAAPGNRLPRRGSRTCSSRCSRSPRRSASCSTASWAPRPSWGATCSRRCRPSGCFSVPRWTAPAPAGAGGRRRGGGGPRRRRRSAASRTSTNVPTTASRPPSSTGSSASGDLIVDPEIAQFAAGQAFLSRGIAGRDQTYLAVHLDPAHRALRVNSLESAVPPTVAGRQDLRRGAATALPDAG